MPKLGERREKGKFLILPLTLLNPETNEMECKWLKRVKYVEMYTEGDLLTMTLNDWRPIWWIA